ncbi:MAG TPA: N-acetylmuramoyl-L-alanine amidase [Symbiobacteriaceae bacterium]|nr:N-acetylmuramoyl-L-alanine amidase [Symbiobacteriaceae bacterium]
MMTLPLTEKIVPQDHAIRSNLPMAPLWITIHETANTNPGADAEMHARYILTQEAIDRQVLWHATVDQDEIIQHIPWTEAGWHAGDGYNGDGNRKSIGIELCVNRDADFAKTQRLAAKLVAYLIKTVSSLKPFPECVVQHNRWSGKDCPHQLRATPGAWEAFIALCQAEIAPAAVTPAVVTQQEVAVTTEPVAVMVDGQLVEMNARLEGDKTRVDLRTLAEALGAEVTWTTSDQGVSTVSIKSKR